jgi:hypothetical protein
VAYRSAPKSVRTLLDGSGLEPEVEAAGAKLAVGDHVLVAGDAPDSVLTEIAVVGDRAVAEVDRLDGRTVNGRVLILAPATRSEYETWTAGDNFDDWGVTGFAAWKGGHSWITLALAQPGLYADTLMDDRQLLEHVIAHEMFHALTTPSGRGRAPLWLTEGFAEMAGQKMSKIADGSPPRRASLPTADQFQPNTPAYFLAWQFALYLVNHQGREPAMRFYFAAVSKHRHSTLHALSKRYLKAPLPALVRRWEHDYATHGPISY